MAFKINRALVAKQVAQQATKVTEKAVTKVLLEKIAESKNVLIQQIDSDPLLKEIDSEGDAFGQIGFEKGERPVGEVKEVIQQGIGISGKDTAQNKKILYTVSFPSDAAIRKTSKPLDWISLDWIGVVRKGITNLRHYLKSATKESRSGKGIQVENNVGGKDVLQDKNLLLNLQSNFISILKGRLK